MAYIANAQHTSALQAFSIREDLSDVIAMISPYDTPFFSMIGSVAATSTKHEWLRDSLTSVDAAGALEGDDFGGVALEVPARASNYTQILRKDFSVTGTNETVTHAGMASQFSYQMMKALRELARNTEQALLCQAQLVASPLGGTGADQDQRRTMDGLSSQVGVAQTWDSTTDVLGVALATSGTEISIDEPAFNLLLQKMWTEGATPDTVLAHPAAKKDITAFTGNVASRFNVGKNELVKNVLQYESDFGTVDVVMERFTPVGGGTADTDPPTLADLGKLVGKASTHTSFVFEREHIRKAVLRPTVAERLPKSGDSERGMVLHELTLEVGATAAVGMWGNIKDD